MDRVVGGKFKLGRKLGSGSFGEIFLGVNVQTGDEVAVKLEPLRSRHPQLHYESKLYMLLQGGKEEEARSAPSVTLTLTVAPQRPTCQMCHGAMMARDGRIHMGNVLFTRVTLHRGPNGDGSLRTGAHDCKPFRLAGLCLRASFIPTSKRRFFGVQNHPHTQD
ncbi:hypothetical protein F2Q70_00042124 [Brassica cretica]|uniref:Protein kinase domain-containing protein n=1 Tax=Brassica cretica TaxID=69181 RepID=A0A8S9KEC4_BRACR|nr:hypothetical protein F2Q70_00042124 [Brassica cretica]